MTMPYVKFYCRDWLHGTESLTPEERGIYIDLLAMMYERNGPLPDDERLLAARLRIDLRVWKRVRQSLLLKGKLTASGGHLSNTRAAAELQLRESYAEAQSERRKKPHTKQGKSRTAVQPTKNHTDTDIEVEAKASTSEADASEAYASPIAIEERAEARPDPVPAAPPDDRESLWALGKPWLKSLRVSEKQAGALLGMLLKAKGPAGALEALAAMMASPPADVTTYVAGMCRAKPRPGDQREEIPWGANKTKRVVIDADGKPQLELIGRAA